MPRPRPRLTAAASLLALCAAAGGAAAATGGTAAPASCPTGLTATHHVDATDGNFGYTICSGRVPSFDGTPLDTDVTIPDGATTPLPLVVMMNGWGNSKTDEEATTFAGNGTNSYDWNNVWFAAHGYAVLNYTARGFHDSCGKDPSTGYLYATDPSCLGRQSWTHLADRRWEVHDAQYLSGVLVDAGVAQPDKIVATGESYGGGQSWLLALSQNRVMEPDGTTVPWTSPKGVPMRLAAAVPQYGWTDLAQALVDNGRGSDGLNGAPVGAQHEDPVGVEKQSYVAGLFADGAAYAQYAGPNDPTADLPGWFAGVSAGEPYSADPITLQALQQMNDYRSAYYMDVPPPGEQVPIFTMQGVTDPLFPAIQSTQEIAKLKAAYPNYPVWAFFGDLGHSYADNPHQTWVDASSEANAWLAQVLAGQRPTAPAVTVTTVPCQSGQSVSVFTGDSLAALESSTPWVFTGTAAQTVSAAVGGPESEGIDPILNSGCRTMSEQTDPGVAAWTFDPKQQSTVTLLGAPVLSVAVTPAGANEELAARLWDVDPATGTQTLITRAVYRLTAAPGSPAQVSFELWPTAWQLLPGHQLKLELTQGDEPTWRADNAPSALVLGAPKLTVPVAAPPTAAPPSANRGGGSDQGTRAATAS